ncbi:homoserine kinase [bacterium]|nr:homoserine kinase [bacterium]
MVKVRVPATTANLGPGYDVLGLALKLYNTVEMEKSDKLSIEIEGAGADSLPKDESNIAYQAAQLALRELKIKNLKLKVKLINKIPLARGLGSSAAARIGAIFAVNKLMGDKLYQDEILKIAAELEGHPDNVTPALVGGLTAVRLAKGNVKYVKYNVRKDLKVIVAIPNFEVSTSEARKVLKDKFTMEDVISTSGGTSLSAGVLAGFGESELLESSMEDRIHQPARSKLVPGMEDVFQAARKAGAQGVALSGSGSTIAAFSIGNSEEKNKEIGQAMVAAFQKVGHKSYYKILDIDRKGAVCL